MLCHWAIPSKDNLLTPSAAERGKRRVDRGLVFLTGSSGTPFPGTEVQHPQGCCPRLDESHRPRDAPGGVWPGWHSPARVGSQLLGHRVVKLAAPASLPCNRQSGRKTLAVPSPSQLPPLQTPARLLHWLYRLHVSNKNQQEG